MSYEMWQRDLFEKALSSLTSACEKTLEGCASELVTLSGWLCSAFENGGKLLICGNGGSAADAQHLAAEFVNRFRLERRPLPAIALTTDTSVITSVSNDYDFDQVFSKQVEALAGPGDIVLGISTSGNSPNVLKALSAAREIGAKTVGLTGGTGGAMERWSDLVLCVDSSDTPRIQEVHIFLEHLLCDLVEQRLFNRP
jgi:D-sedoheptulose 7-phosphate isomerase